METDSSSSHDDLSSPSSSPPPPPSPSSSSSPSPSFSPHDRIIQRLMVHGVSEEYLQESQAGLVSLVKAGRAVMQDLVPVILPSDGEIEKEVLGSRAGLRRDVGSLTLKKLFRESMLWLQWLMFEGEPNAALNKLGGRRGVCGAVWGKGDIAFRCRTCEQDPTCAVCVPCFRNGNHENHDYSIIYTTGGCCDCGDETAWKRDGFCSKHQGADKMQSLPDDAARSIGPVLDAIFECWKRELIHAESISMEIKRPNNQAETRNVANELTFAVVEMLLDFCYHSESLLSFVSRRVSALDGLLDVLVRSERFLRSSVIKRLHELLLKFLGDPVFKYELAKAFVSYYPIKVGEIIMNSIDPDEKRDLLHPSFSVQIFTVPTLTLHLVKEVKLLAVLLNCLGDILLACFGEDGRLQMDKWGKLSHTSCRVIEDIKYVMGHPEVVEHVIQEHHSIYRVWLKILSYVQGVNPLKRETSMHIEEENQNVYLPFVFCHSIANINSLLVGGAFSIADEKVVHENIPSNTVEGDTDNGLARHKKVGRLSQDSCACISSGHGSGSDSLSQVTEMKPDGDRLPLVPSSISWLALECLRTLDHWLGSVMCPAFDAPAAGSAGFLFNNFSAFKKALPKTKKGRYGLYDRRLFANDLVDAGNERTPTDQFGSSQSSHNPEGQQDTHPLDTAAMNIDDPDDLTHNEDSITAMEIESEAFSVLRSADWHIIDYDVSCQEISVHIPLHEFLAVILKEALGKCCGLCVTPLPISNVFLEQVISGCHPYGFSSSMMDHPLRNRVFCAQVHAGMWRRNGYAAMLACDGFPHRLELDLFLLQFCAALAPDDLYVTRILERFGLLDYLSLNLDLSSEYESVLVQEMLILIIQIVQERRFCGFTTSENLQRELVCKLASGDATHSQLVKALPRDLSKADQLQEILDAISQYSNPSQMNQGKYSLRAQYWKELDLYHPRWSPKDLQVAQDRYLHFSGVSALTKQLPKWTKIYQPLSGVSRIATCKMVLQIIRAVLFYSVFANESAESRAPDGVLVTALHLLSLGLDICSMQKESGHRLFHDGKTIPLLDFAGEVMNVKLHSKASQQSLLSLLVMLMRMHKKDGQRYQEAGNLNLSSLVESVLMQLAKLGTGCMSKLQQFAPEVVDHLFQSTENKCSTNLGSNSDVEKQRIKARERQAAALAKMKAQQSSFLASMKNSANDDLDASTFEQKHVSSDENRAQATCSLCHDPNSKDPVSYLVLLQKSRLVSFVEQGPLSWDKDRRKYSNEVSPMVNKMADPSGSNASAEHTEMLSPSQLRQLVQAAVDDFAHHARAVEVDAFIDYVKFRIPALKHIHLPHRSTMAREATVCSIESLEKDMFLSIENDIYGTAKDVEITEVGGNFPNERDSTDMDSALFGKYIASVTRESVEDYPLLQNEGSHTSDPSSPALPYDGVGPSGCDGIHISSCGHVVHQECLDRYLSSLKERSMRRIAFEGGHIVDPTQGEFLCPVCRRLSNSILLAVPEDSQKLWNLPSVSRGSPLGSSKSSITTDFGTDSLQLQHAVSLLGAAASVVSKGNVLKALPLQQSRSAKTILEPVFQVAYGMYFSRKQDTSSKSGRVSPSLVMWDVLKYSIESTEIASRFGKGGSTSMKGHSSMYNELKSSGIFTLPLLLRIVQSTRTKNSLDVLLRFKGIQLFAESVCSGGHPSESSGGAGNMWRVLKHIDANMMFLDTHFWNQAADPVLMRDPFSTLMRILFCLPYPILSCGQSLLSLVHIFYAVSVVQAAIMYCGRSQSSVEELDLHDSLLTDVFKLVKESGIIQQYFITNYLDSSGHVEDAIRNQCLPFLRRCALLWELLSSSKSALLPDKMNLCSFIMESNKFNNLENLFGIPSLNVVLKDKLLRSLAFKWFHHFHKKIDDGEVQRVLHLTPPVPFQLMHLPILYQDLVQRYIKPRCPDCKTVQDEPALCLLCGRQCSHSRKSCCSESSCQTHATSCGAGTGVFLLIRRTTILLQRDARQAPWPSPYLDVHGEEDIGMQRGKPLYLNEERYAALSHMVAFHGLDRSSKVLRQTTIGTLFMV